MTVDELKELLATMPGDAEVVYWNGEYMYYERIGEPKVKRLGVRYNGRPGTKEFPVWEDGEPLDERQESSFEAVDLTVDHE